MDHTASGPTRRWRPPAGHRPTPGQGHAAGHRRAAGHRLVVALGAAALALVCAVAGPAGRASADPIGRCGEHSGVLVAVDFAPWGGPVTRGCDAATTTGLAALGAAGFAITGVAAYGDAFVCRIDDLPGSAQESCETTPPADAYWSFWYADADQSAWHYSAQGASTFVPAPGSVEAWVFGATDTAGTDGAPVFTPAAVRGRPAAPAPTTTVPTTTVPATTVPATTAPPTTTPATTTAPPNTTGRPAVGTGPSPATVPAATTTTVVAGVGTSTVPTGAAPAATTDPAASSTPPTTAVHIVDAAGSAPGHGSGSAAGAVAAGVLVTVLGAAGVVAARRRRGPP